MMLCQKRRAECMADVTQRRSAVIMTIEQGPTTAKQIRQNCHHMSSRWFLMGTDTC